MTVLSLAGVRVVKEGRLTLDLPTLEVAEGECLGVIGANGAGKSTLLRVLAGLETHGGKVESASFGPFDDRRLRAHHIAYVPQDFVVPPHVTVRDFVMLGRRARLGFLGREGPSDHEATEGALGRMELLPLASRFVDTLSGGERQRAVVAQALCQDTGLLLLDEPTTGLDLGHREKLWRLLRTSLQPNDRTVVMSIHDLESAAVVADRLLLLKDGRPLALGPPGEVLTNRLLSDAFDHPVTVARSGEHWLIRPG